MIKRYNHVRKSFLFAGRFLPVLFASYVLSPSPANAHDLFASSKTNISDEEAMIGLFYEGTTTLATRTPVKTALSPAVITVITGEQIALMGARDLRDVLNMVPGIYVTNINNGMPQVNMRGISTQGSEKILFMIDDHPVNSQLTGGGTMFFADMSVEHIQRVEVMRGTGSSLYGANAFVGIVNIITRKAGEIDGLHVSSRAGSFDTQRHNVEAGKKFGDLELWGNVNYHHTNGADVMVQRDALSSDPKNANVSLAPGPASEWVERTEAYFGAKYRQFAFDGGYFDHKDGQFFNPSLALSDSSEFIRRYLWGALSWHDHFLDDRLTLKASLCYHLQQHEHETMLQPPGFTNPAGNVFLNGMRTLELGDVDESGLNIQGDYQLNSQTITLGVEAKNVDVRTHMISNYNPKPLPAMVDTTATFNWMSPGDRFYYAVYMQDLWRITDDVSFTAGFRNDQYDDVGQKLSPSLSLVYQATPEIRLKAMYGEAFRAPSMREMYKKEAGAPLIGNIDIEPEEVATWQAGIDWQPSKAFDMGFYVFYSDYEKLIKEVYNPVSKKSEFENHGKAVVTGAELSMSYNFLKGKPNSKVFLNIGYSNHDAIETEDPPALPNWVISGGLGWDFAKNLHLNMTSQYVGSSETSSIDPRDGFDDYMLANVTLTAKDALGYVKGLDVHASVYNLFDADYSFPETTAKLPDNYQQPGITAEVMLRYSFR